MAYISYKNVLRLLDGVAYLAAQQQESIERILLDLGINSLEEMNYDQFDYAMDYLKQELYTPGVN